MAQLRTNNSFNAMRNTIKRSGTFLDLTFMLCFFSVIAFFFLCGGYAVHATDYNTAAKARHGLVSMFELKDVPSDVRTSRRMELARSLLYEKRYATDTTLGKAAFGSYSERVLAQKLNIIAANGSQLTLDYSKASVRRLWQRYVPMLLGSSLLLLISLPVTVANIVTARKRHYFVADVPWNKAWPYIWVLLTPLGIPFYIVGYVRLRKHKRAQAALNLVTTTIEHMPALAVDEFLDLPPDLDDLDWSSPLSQAAQFFSAPHAARELYHTMRIKDWRQHLLELKESIAEDIMANREQLRLLGLQIRSAQQLQNELTAQAREYEAIDPATAPIPTGQYVDGEFDRLLTLPGVEGVRVINGQISVKVVATIKYDGITYDLGDWELRFGNGDYLYSRELRSGLRSEWSGGTYPSYLLSGGDFCFGDLESAISGNVRKGQYIEALEVAIACVQSVNENDQHNIPLAFMEVQH